MASSTLSLGSLFSVEGYVALITGGGTGLGYWIAEGLVKNGATVYITGRREGVLKEAADTLNALGAGKGRAVPFPADVTSKEDVEKLVRFVEEKEQAVDLLVNNAGKYTPETLVTFKSPLLDFQSALWSSSKDAWTDQYAANTWGPHIVTTAFLHLLGRAAEKGNGRGSVIVLTSINARQWNPHWSTSGYNTSKASAEGLAKILAAKLHPYRIRVNVVAPGSFPSDLNPPTNDFSMSSPANQHNIPLGRSGTAEDIAGTVIWLTSRAGAYVTGHILDIDGGLLLIANTTNKITP